MARVTRSDVTHYSRKKANRMCSGTGMMLFEQSTSWMVMVTITLFCASSGQLPGLIDLRVTSICDSDCVSKGFVSSLRVFCRRFQVYNFCWTCFTFL